MKRSSTLGLLGCVALTLGSCGRAPQRPNVLFIIVDTLRADHLSCAGYERETSPNINSFAAESLRFTHAQTPRAKTTPAVASIFTGLYPHGHGVRDLVTPLPIDVPVLAERFHQEGYATGAIISNFVLRDDFSGLGRGFDVWIEDFPSSHGVPPNHVPQRLAGSVTDGILSALGIAPAPADGAGPETCIAADGQPWLLWAHYMDPHGLYMPPPEHDRFHSESVQRVPLEPQKAPGAITEPWLGRYNLIPSDLLGDGDIDAAQVIDRYDGEISYLDAELGRLFGELERSGALEDTLIIFVADHGESLGEHDYWFEHGRHTYEATCRVPLIIRLPDNFEDRPNAGVRSGDVSLADLAPTLIELLSLEPLPASKALYAAGESFVPLLLSDRPSDRPVFSEKVERAKLQRAIQSKAVRLGDWKYIRRYTFLKPSTGGAAKPTVLSEELYDLSVDPMEAQNLASAPPSDAPIDRLRAELLAFCAGDVHFAELARELQARRDSLELKDPETLRILKSLGY